MRTLFKNAIILATVDGEFKVLKDAYLGVEDTVIDYIGENKPTKKYDTIKNMSNRILMPGLINVHGHGPMTLLRGLGSGLPLERWLNEAIFPVEARLVPSHIYAGEIWAIAEMLKSGTTMCAEMYDFPWSIGRAMLDTGFKGTISRVGLSFPTAAQMPRRRFEECLELVENWRDETGKVSADLCLHSCYLSTPDFVKKLIDANKTLKRGVHIHLAETQQEVKDCRELFGGKTPIEYFNKMGLFENRTYAAHCVWLTRRDMEIMKEKNVTAVNNPSSNCKLASGFAPMNRLQELGINVALGTDGCASNNNLNMFEEMHLASIIRKGVGGDPTAASAESMLKVATINGAKALGREETGELVVGKKADIIAVSMDEPHMFPAYDIPNLLIYSAQGSDVCMTMIDGRILYENGEYTTIDFEKARFDMENAIKDIIK